MNNGDQYNGVFIQLKVWLKRSLGQLEGGGMGRGRARVQGQSAGQGPKWRPVVRQICKGETVRYQSEEEEPWYGSDQTIAFQEAIFFP